MNKYSNYKFTKKVNNTKDLKKNKKKILYKYKQNIHGGRKIPYNFKQITNYTKKRPYKFKLSKYYVKYNRTS